ncbi:NAD(P)-dependent oxidoreductase [Steroidobacter flavus]|uniref:NAD(P)-dependent oxidoreductase n=1 Tax=Steroidobacter flavus TaxID=1842136 RepID=A0ABV8SZD9_9GAMM
MASVGFIGLGSQGGPMARRLIESGHEVRLWARRAEAYAPFADISFTRAESVADLGARSEYVGVCVVDDAGVRQVCDQLLGTMKPGSLLAVHSTVHPQTVVALAQRAAEREIAFIDAPVSGGGPAAAARTLTVMCGGSEAAFSTARPVFECFAGLIVRVGEVGAGQMAKLVNNALMAAHVALAHSALTAGDALALDRRALKEIVKASSGRSFGFDVYARLPDPYAFAHGAKLLLKDVRLLSEVLDADPAFAPIQSVALPFLELIQRGVPAPGEIP